MLTIGSLFAGIGGLELGLEWAGLGPVIWQVERDAWCRAVLAHHWPAAARVGNVKLFHADRHGRRPREWGHVDLICGGFPCQDVSGAGKGAGLAGARSGLWREFARVVGEFLPAWVVVENVASGANRWVDAVVRDLAQLGYASLPCPLSASDVGAPHRRARIFVVARRVRDTDSQQKRDESRRRSGTNGRGETVAGDVVARRVRDTDSQQKRDESRRRSGTNGRGETVAGDVGAEVADSDGVDGAARNADARQERAGRTEPRRSGSPLGRRQRPSFGHDPDGSRGAWPWPPAPDDARGWAEYIAAGGPQPAIRRAAHGLPCGMARHEWERQLRAMGNAVCPEQAEVIGWIVRELANDVGTIAPGSRDTILTAIQIGSPNQQTQEGRRP